MKKIIILLFSIFIIVPQAVKAKEVYITQNGVSMDKTSYEVLCKNYSKGYVETLTTSEYIELTRGNLNDIQKVTYDYKVANMFTKGSFYSETNKSISIVKNGNYVTVLAKWINHPAVNSYDVIAVRLSGVSLNGSFTFKQVYKSGGSYYTLYNGNSQTFTNGFGSSALLHSGSDQEYSLTFKVSGTGTVYGSYQHAITSVTLAQSKNYTISSSGLGGVINFASSVIGYYDGMPGVSLSV